MLSKRVIALSSDKALSRRLGAGLMAAGGSAEVRESLEELPRGEIQADLIAIHVSNEGERAWIEEVNRRAAKNASIMAVINASSLDEVVKAMRGNRVAAVMVADQLEAAHVAAVATRLLYGDVFGLEKVVPWGVRVYSHLVGDYQEKSVAISAVSDYAASIGVRRKYREPIEQCLDEMLMNALYDAPVDAEGKQLFADVPTKTRISLRMEQKAVVQYACDGNQFSLSVRDSFGALKQETVTEYLYKCLYSSQQIDRKAGGAGLGLYIIANASTQFFVNLYPGLATEVVVTFDLNAAKVQLKEFGLFQEKIDSAGRLVAGPSRLVKTGQIPIVQQPAANTSKGVIAALAAALVLLLALIAVVAYPQLVHRGVGAVTVSTTPPGAEVEVEGRTIGTTTSGPVTVGGLEAGRAYKVTAHLEGHEPAEQIVVPQKDGNAALTLDLEARKPVVVFETDPPGAIVRIGDRQIGTTPFSTTELASDSGALEVTFDKPGYQLITRSVRLPDPGKQGTIYTAMAVAGDFGTVSLESNPPGARVTHNGTLLPTVTPVPDLLLEGGKSHTLVFAKDGFRPVTKEITVEAGKKAAPIAVEMVPGGSVTVTASVPNAKITVAGTPCKAQPSPMTCGVANGTHRVIVEATNPFLRDRFEVKVEGNEVTRDIRYGVVEAPRDFTLKAPGAPKNTTKMALSEGTHSVNLVNAAGEVKAKQVRVTAGKTTTIEP